jgi:NAD-dependent dihydropyrimidine dehydrogenase PreA subunit
MDPQARRSSLVAAIEDVIPNAVHGVFKLTETHARLAPAAASASVKELVGWHLLVYAIPITEDGLWIWHHHNGHRSLMANYILSQAAAKAQADAAGRGEAVVKVSQHTNNQVSMVELGELAGIGARGWNNLLLHPRYGSWLQIEALASREQLEPEDGPSVPLDPCLKCMNCIFDCPVGALNVWNDFRIGACSRVVASPWHPKSKAVALTSSSYLECRECISACPVGERPEGIFEWRR